MAAVRPIPELYSQPITFPVAVDAAGPLPDGQAVYDNLRACAATGFRFLPLQLLHAIGSKPAVLPSSAYDDCIDSARKFLYLIELDGQTLWFRDGIPSDFQTPRSQEIGVGMMCLIAGECFDVEWDQLEAIPGRGRRFDYRATTPRHRCIFESKGTKYRYSQRGQIAEGLEKKIEHHNRGERYDVELIISTHVGVNGDHPRVLVADPEFPNWDKAFTSDSAALFRHRHFSRAFQFAGMTRAARSMYLRSRVIEGKQDFASGTMIPPESGEIVHVDGDDFIGRWVESPQDSWLIERLSSSEGFRSAWPFLSSMRIFQGIRRSVYTDVVNKSPEAVEISRFSESRLVVGETESRQYSIFPDGTILMLAP